MPTSNDNLLKQWIEAENSRDVEKVLTLLTDDIVIEDVTFGVVMRIDYSYFDTLFSKYKPNRSL